MKKNSLGIIDYQHCGYNFNMSKKERNFLSFGEINFPPLNTSLNSEAPQTYT